MLSENKSLCCEKQSCLGKLLGYQVAPIFTSRIRVQYLLSSLSADISAMRNVRPVPGVPHP
jgi:lipid-A-disaccharide synthase-like uncharacterized protein